MESVSTNYAARQESQQYPKNVTSQEISTSTWCPLKCKIQLIHSKGALLMMWVTLMNIMYWYSLTGGHYKQFQISEETNYPVYLQLILQILSPYLVGLLMLGLEGIKLFSTVC